MLFLEGELRTQQVEDAFLVEGSAWPGPPGAWLAKGDHCAEGGRDRTHSKVVVYMPPTTTNKVQQLDKSCHIMSYTFIRVTLAHDITSVALYHFVSQNPYRHDLQ